MWSQLHRLSGRREDPLSRFWWDSIILYLHGSWYNQKTFPYTSQQNNVVERKHKYLLETTRAVLFQSKLPIRYRGECVLTATHIINRLPSNHLKDKCPYELLYKKKIDYNHLKSFGCLCYPLYQKCLGISLNQELLHIFFLGYPFGTKGYKVMSLATKKIHVGMWSFMNISFLLLCHLKIPHFLLFWGLFLLLIILN